MTRSRHPRTRQRTSRSLASSAAFETFVLDQLADLGDVLARKMFGGVGLYCDGYFFGIVARNVLYLKVDARSTPAYAARGSRPFAPYPDRPGTMQYYAVPLDVLESGSELVRWAREAVAIARRAARGPARHGGDTE
jgi:DNA transformation protein